MDVENFEFMEKSELIRAVLGTFQEVAGPDHAWMCRLYSNYL